MAELGITFPPGDPYGSGGGGSVEIAVDKLSLTRTGGRFEVNTPVSLESPGVGWALSGDTVTYSGGSEFIGSSQLFHNGDLLQTASASGTGVDSYFVASPGSFIAFDFHIEENDVIQAWKFAATTSG